MNNKSRTKNSIINLTTSFGNQILLIIVRFLCRTVFIYTLGKSYLGINGLFSDILTMLSLTELGLDTAINFKLYKPLAEKDIARTRILMKFYKFAYLCVGITILILGIALLPLLPHLINDYDTLKPLGINAEVIYILYLLQSVTSYLFFASKSAIIKADQKEYIINITGFASNLLMNLFQIVALLVWKSFTLYVACMVVFGILLNVVNAIIAVHQYPDVFKKTDDKIRFSEVKDIFTDLGALFISKINNVVLKATDNLVLSTFIGLSIVGVYSNYLLLYATIKSLLAKVFNATKASMGNLFAVSDSRKKNDFFELMNYITIILYGTAAVGVIVVSDELIECWIGSSYVIKQPFAILMGIEILFMGIKNNLNQIRNVAGLFRQMWLRPLMGIFVNLGVSIGLVQICGIYGVLIGTIVADILTSFIVDPRIINKYGLDNLNPVSKYYKRNIMYFTILIGVCCMDAVLCKIILPGRGWASIFVHSIICGVTVPGIFLLIYCRTKNGKYILHAIIKRFIHA